MKRLSGSKLLGRKEMPNRMKALRYLEKWVEKNSGLPNRFEISAVRLFASMGTHVVGSLRVRKSLEKVG